MVLFSDIVIGVCWWLHRSDHRRITEELLSSFVQMLFLYENLKSSVVEMGDERGGDENEYREKRLFAPM